MAFIAPFRAVRFNPAKVEKMEDVVSPPYDVIDPAAQAALEAKDQYNMIKLDLTKRGGTEISDERYDGARETFGKWQEDEVLIRDEVPAIYLYHIDYTLPNGTVFRRKGLSAMARLHEFSEGIVKPHEKTFRGVTDDRLRLIDTCQAQFSQIFSLYSDENNEVMQTLEQGMAEEPLCSATDQDGCVHSIWAVTDPEILAKVQGLFADKPLYIADGHHRYTTSLRLRETMKEREGSVPEESPYNHIMMYLCPMEDKGLSVLPTHRLVHYPGKISTVQLVEKMSGSFGVEEIKNGTREAQIAEVLVRMEDARSNHTAFGMYDPAEDRCFLLTLKDGAMDRELGIGGSEVLRALDVVVLSDLIIDKILGLCHEKCDDEDLIQYYADPDEALDAAVKKSTTTDAESPILFLMNNTPVKQVQDVADQDLFMPHKSTYFYPKVLTGLLLNKIVPDEAYSQL
ncbi:MAG: DUF1015 domain-containing protein [Desulfobulbaceae bacterium]|jgi:uncharacterized protein (DUF1015 family)|nr:DUF1015 domain-containing protein [Desulfobulbaceae bacterium]